MNGAGNDFIILDAIHDTIDLNDVSRIARVLCTRHMSIGADGMMVVVPAEGKADFRMLFYNSDGTMGEMCGNGARCICRYGYEHGLSGEEQTIETTAGIVTGKRIDRINYRIRLNDPSVLEAEKKLDAGGAEYGCAYVELGNPGIPHLVVDFAPLRNKISGSGARLFELPEDENEKLKVIARKLRWHPALPKGANVNFYEIIGEDEIDELTFERGVEDYTYACGTGTGSVVKILTDKRLVSGKDVKVNVKGGLLKIDIEDGIYLTGPTNVVAEGTVLDENL